MDYEISTVSSHDGNGGKVQVVEVFNTTTGKPISFTSRIPFEKKSAWIARAFAAAERAGAQY